MAEGGVHPGLEVGAPGHSSPRWGLFVNTWGFRWFFLYSHGATVSAACVGDDRQDGGVLGQVPPQLDEQPPLSQEE